MSHLFQSGYDEREKIKSTGNENGPNMRVMCHVFKVMPDYGIETFSISEIIIEYAISEIVT